MKARCSLIALLWLGCAPDHDLEVEDVPEAASSADTDPSAASAVPNDPARFIRLESLDAAEESSKKGVTLDLRLHNARNVDARSEIRVRITTEHGARWVVVAGPPVPAGESADLHISEESIPLSDQPLTFSGELRVDAEVTYADEMREQSNSVFRHFHADKTVWRAYDQQTRDEHYAGGALTAELRASRDRLLGGATASEHHVFLGVAHGSKISDDPAHVPQLEGESHE